MVGLRGQLTVAVARRRTVLAGAAALALPALATAVGGARRFTTPGDMPGSMTGADWHLGHRMRDGGLPEPSTTARTDVVVVGGGVAGLSAAWHLHAAGVDDVAVVELETEPGGNAASGRNAVSAYPWGAHYVPMLAPESTDAAALFADLGLITGHDAAGRPVYDEASLCADPRERLLRWGEWQEDLLPSSGVTRAEQAQYRSFFGAMDRFRAARGTDGRRAFAIPVAESSADPQFRALDAISFARFLGENGWNAPPLRWYLRYCCRDDYGTEPEHVSAWAGIHYFASRGGRGDGPHPVLTWPGGNGHIVALMGARLPPPVCSALAWRVAVDTGGVAVDVFEPATGRSRRIHARAAVLAVPRFVADRLLKRPGNAGASYAPWVVANITVSAMPEGRGWPLCWDNVPYGSESLGYVVATHQSVERVPRRTVLTWYMPLSTQAPADARRAALDRPLHEWQRLVADDLLLMHPELDGAIQRIDVRLWGHAMIRPEPGFIWSTARAAAGAHAPPVFFAHSDMSGISIFEEANMRGTAAARAVRCFLG